MKISKNEFVTALSFALDYLEISIRKHITNHNKRVGLISVYIGRAMGLDDRSIFDLSAYAMLHDNGITHEVYNVMADDGVHRLEQSLSHCIKGEENIESFPFLEKRSNVIKYHHESFDGSGYFGIQGKDIPLFSQIISLADMVEIAYQNEVTPTETIENILNLRGTKFSHLLCEAFKNASRPPAFWLSLDNAFINRELDRYVPVFHLNIDYPKLLVITKIISEIIDTKSPFTGEHSNGLSKKASDMAGYYGFDEERKTKLIIAANLHDVGKLVIPNSIIDKPGRLTPEEFQIIKSHTFYTRKVIESVKGFEDICEWAANHHEKMDGSGYPYGMPEQILSFESQLIACLDIYQALTEERPYREGLPHEKACGILTGMAEKGSVSREIAADIKEFY
jgi:HD-GYP domain-containing protein (c-di-GMP phosphodiesterase class II)